MSKEVGLKVSVLASGSTGNATYIETPKQKLSMLDFRVKKSKD